MVFSHFCWWIEFIMLFIRDAALVESVPNIPLIILRSKNFLWIGFMNDVLIVSRSNKLFEELRLHCGFFDFLFSASFWIL